MQDVCSGGTCINTIGSFKCECGPGFVLESFRCVDIDECKEGNPCGGRARWLFLILTCRYPESVDLQPKVGVIPETAIFREPWCSKFGSRPAVTVRYMKFRPSRSRPGVRYVMPVSGMDRDFNDPQRFGPLWPLWTWWIVNKPWFRSKKEPYSVDIRQKCSFFGLKSRFRDGIVMAVITVQTV